MAINTHRQARLVSEQRRALVVSSCAGCPFTLAGTGALWCTFLPGEDVERHSEHETLPSVCPLRGCEVVVKLEEELR